MENAIGLIREYIPKKAKLENYSDSDIFAIVDLINNTPRKCLDYKTPQEIFNEQYLSKFSKFNYSSGALQGLMQGLLVCSILLQIKLFVKFNNKYRLDAKMNIILKGN